VKGTMHWVSAKHAISVEARNYNHLFTMENPDEADDFTQGINPDSLEVISNAFAEPSLAEAAVSDSFQFLRQAYYCVDPDSTAEKKIFNRVVPMRDSWAKIAKTL